MAPPNWVRRMVCSAIAMGISFGLVGCSGDEESTTTALPTATTVTDMSSTTVAASSTTVEPADVSAEARTIIIDLGGRNGPNGIVLEISADLLFDSGSSTLKPGAQPTIDKLARLTRLIVRDRIAITGHTDNVGGPVENQRLSVDRAQAVADALKAANAEVGGRVLVRGEGERQPVADNATTEGRAKNRRVEVVFQGARFRP